MSTAKLCLNWTTLAAALGWLGASLVQHMM